MTAKRPDDLCSKGNIEVASSVIANWLEDEQPRARMALYRAAKAARLKAIHERSVRETEVQLKCTQSFKEPAAVARFLRKRLGHLGYEAFGFLFLNAKHEYIAFEILFRGSNDRTHAYAREVSKRGLELNAAALFVCHNQLTGNAEPSQADIGLTRSLFDLCERVEIRLLDHVLVSANTWVSLQLRGLL